MAAPDDDFDDDDFDDSDPVIDTVESMVASNNKDQAHYDTRRKIEEIMERRRLREEFGDIDL